MKQQLSGVKPVQMSELETEFEKSSGEKAKPSRLLRSQQAFGGNSADQDDAEGKF